MRHTICECGGDVMVKDSRLAAYGVRIRYRECKRCGDRWQTIELGAEYAKEVNPGSSKLSRLKACWKTINNILDEGDNNA